MDFGLSAGRLVKHVCEYAKQDIRLREILLHLLISQ
jgi:hypothetical protein